MKQKILVVDDELGPRESLKAIFGLEYDVILSENGDQAMSVLSAESVDLVLMDVMMPGRNGLEFLKDIQNLYPEMPVVMISASTSVRPVVEAMRVGASDYVSKPFDVEDILHIARRALENTRLHRRVEVLESEVAREFPVAGMVGESEAFKHAMHDVGMAAETDATVLIGGESGTGKELAARLLHTLSPRKDEPFVAVHCAALPETLLESELFGHEKGAFTGANKLKPGRVVQAGCGSLFFDEIGELEPSMQVKLLRVVQEREFMRVGGTRVIKTNARIVTAIARDLREEVKAGRFRDDLFYRLSVVPVQLPSLKKRVGDIPLLVNHFLAVFRESMGCKDTVIAPAAMDLLCRYEWPGNIRELRNIIERMLVLHRKKPTILPEHLPEEFHPEGTAPLAVTAPADINGTLLDTVNGFERQLIERALIETNGVQTKAANKLGTTRRILRYRMEKLDINVGVSPKTEQGGDTASTGDIE
jgi:DNA-binding NtrC family response regulator